MCATLDRKVNAKESNRASRENWLKREGQTGKGEVEDKIVEEHCKVKEKDSVRDYIWKRYCRHILINMRKSTGEAGGDRKEQTINKARENVKLCVWGVTVQSGLC